MSRDIIPVFLNQDGCPFKCVYCEQGTLWGDVNAVSSWEVEGFLNGALEKVKNRGVVELAFYGGTFTGLPLEVQKSYLRIAKQAKQEHRIQAIRLSTRPDLLSRETLEVLKSFGVDTVEIGAQSLDDDVLRLSKRGYQAETVRAAVVSLKKVGLRVGVQLMCGLPGDNYERFMKTVREVIRLRPAFTRLYPTLVIAGTVLDKMYQVGEYRALELFEAVEWCAAAKEMLEDAGVKVIRVGLHLSMTEELRAKIVAGPVHSAFGQMVKSRIIRKKAERVLKLVTQAGEKTAQITVPQRLLSDFLGVKREEYQYLQRQFPELDLSWKICPPAGGIRVEASGMTYPLGVNR